MAKRKNPTQHDQMASNIAYYLESNGSKDIRADVYGFTAPELIKWKSRGDGHIPDVTARNGQLSIFEVETDDSIFDAHTEDQWKLFEAYAQQHNAKFYVVVPRGSETDARGRLKQLRIQAEIWTT